ncbi:uncharacterized protein LOC133726898 [Rosa rugosa]|uniref:uncharacterized protein LOC133726898 n=1 Tax=Rosa rugosa TaxID=74645 RepID=UPI002B4071D9|nr:uncharacterized protein LOC133726898 [Rosa rugosa]
MLVEVALAEHEISGLNFLSINLFERKKNIDLAISAFAMLRTLEGDVLHGLNLAEASLTIAVQSSAASCSWYGDVDLGENLQAQVVKFVFTWWKSDLLCLLNFFFLSVLYMVNGLLFFTFYNK